MHTLWVLIPNPSSFIPTPDSLILTLTKTSSPSQGDAVGSVLHTVLELVTRTARSFKDRTFAVFHCDFTEQRWYTGRVRYLVTWTSSDGRLCHGGKKLGWVRWVSRTKERCLVWDSLLAMYPQVQARQDGKASSSQDMCNQVQVQARDGVEFEYLKQAPSSMWCRKRVKYPQMST